MRVASLCSGARRSVLLIALAVCACLTGCRRQTDPAGAYPTRTITVYVNSSQGGATDRWARFVTRQMQPHLGVNLVCVNLPGAKGGTGAMKVMHAPHDGYTLLACSENAVFFDVNDVGPPVDQWHFLIAGGSRAAIGCRADAPWKSLDEVASEQSSVRIANGGTGKLWHLRAAQWEQRLGANWKHVPYPGSGPAITALLSGEVDLVSCSRAELAPFVRSGKVRFLENTGQVEAGDGPDGHRAEPELRQWLGLAIPRGVAPDVVDRLTAAFEKVVQSERMAEWAEADGSEVIGLAGKPADRLAAQMQARATQASVDLGLSQLAGGGKL